MNKHADNSLDLFFCVNTQQCVASILLFKHCCWGDVSILLESAKVEQASYRSVDQLYTSWKLCDDGAMYRWQEYLPMAKKCDLDIVGETHKLISYWGYP